MANKYIVDAHALIWYVENNSRLGPNAGAALDDASSELFLPIISLAEACWVVEHGRCRIPAVSALLADIDDDPRIVLIQLDRTILDIVVTLTAIKEMHDRFITATSIALEKAGHTVQVLTKDENIRASGLVRTLW